MKNQEKVEVSPNHNGQGSQSNVTSVVTDLDKEDLKTLNYTISQLLIESLKSRMDGDGGFDTTLTRYDLSELSHVLYKLNQLNRYLPEAR